MPTTSPATSENVTLCKGDTSRSLLRETNSTADLVGVNNPS
ncbi:hypothetical protein P1S61_40485 [Streptomyces sp. ME08-AFT2]|nr:hypothetical protein [Streptomyces sp. ME08-AFT2]MDX3315216.1 hypothetical protein [Streptomyces sp. ME08-AFT2]